MIDNGNSTAGIEQSAVEERKRDSRPSIGLDLELHEKVDAAAEALVAANDPDNPDVMVRGSELTRMTERGELEAYGPDSLRDRLSRSALFTKVTKDEIRSVDPPMDVARTLLARDSGEYRGLPRVDRVVDIPVLARDGELVTRPGHHAGSRLFYRPAPGLESVAPDAVEFVDDVVSARDFLLDELLGDFAFVDEADRANALALVLLPFVRDYIGDAPTPLHVILAPEPGTGKTLLAQAALMPSCGYVPPMAGDRDGNDEWRKTLTASLLRGERAILFDNLKHGIDSGPVAAALTSGVWRDRILGESREATLPVRDAWVATGNNLDLSDEIARRAVPIFLDPGDVRPADRPKSAYRHPDLSKWAAEHRAELARAALTLVQHWLDGDATTLPGHHEFVRTEGYRRPADRTLGSFEEWAEVIGGILVAADVPGFLENRDRLDAEANEERRELVTFFRTWYETGGSSMTIRELANACAYRNSLNEAVPVELASVASTPTSSTRSSPTGCANTRTVASTGCS